MKNLIEETRSSLLSYGKTEEEIEWVGSRDGTYSLPWSTFVLQNRNFEYEDLLDEWTVPLDLVIVGDGWWLERIHDYDREWWVVKEAPVRKNESISFGCLKALKDYSFGRPFIDECKDKS